MVMSKTQCPPKKINSANPQKIHNFPEKLLCSVQALDTMRKIK